VLKAWYSLQEKNTKELQVANNTIIWGNSNVKHNGKVLMFKEWVDAGIIFLKDITVGNRFISLDELSKMIVSAVNMFQLYKLIGSIPDSWKTKIRNNEVICDRKSRTLFETKNRNLKHISQLKTKDMYLSTDISLLTIHGIMFLCLKLKIES